MVPGDSLVRIRIDDEHEVIALLQIATEDPGLLEIDREALRRPDADPLAQAFQLPEVDALIGADGAKTLRTDVKHAIGPELDGFASAIEEKGADGAGGDLQQLAKDSLKRHATPRLEPVPRSECRPA